MRIIVSADDFGLTRGITDGILSAFDNGTLTSTSVITNGDAFGYAIEQWRSRIGLGLTLHVNLMEGTSTAPPKEVRLLLDDQGEMNLSFVKLLALSLRLRGRERDRLRGQIRSEIEAQLGAVAATAGPDWQPRVDGHQHYHMIPIVLEALLELHERWQFHYVRVTEEPHFFVTELRRAVPNYLGPNIAKHALLHVLASAARRQLERRGIAHCRRFVGLIFSGNMTIEPVRAALGHLRGLERRGGEEELVEFLLHPGRASQDEEPRWRRRPELGAYYLSPWRDVERATLCSGEFQALVSPHLLRHNAAA